MPLVMNVVDVMHRPRHPKAALRILVLHLMTEGGKQNEQIGADHPADARRQGNQKWRPHQEPAVFEIVPKLQEHPLRGAASMMLTVCFPRPPGHRVHKAVPPIFGKAAEDEAPDSPSRRHANRLPVHSLFPRSDIWKSASTMPAHLEFTRTPSGCKR